MCHANDLLGSEAKMWISTHLALYTPRAQHQAGGAPLPAAPAAEAGTGAWPPCTPPDSTVTSPALRCARHACGCRALEGQKSRGTCCAGKGEAGQRVQPARPLLWRYSAHAAGPGKSACLPSEQPEAVHWCVILAGPCPIHLFTCRAQRN